MPPIWEKTEAESIATDLLMLTVWQAHGLTLTEIARQMGITSGLALRYDRAINDLMDDLNEAAAPDAPEAAPDPCERNRHG